MDVGVADPTPTAKLDPQLEGRLGTRHEFALIDPDPLIEAADVRDGGLADANGADLERFNEAYGHAATEGPGKSRSRHPARRAATCNDDSSDRAVLRHTPRTLLAQ